jgi:hypothetical protein
LIYRLRLVDQLGAFRRTGEPSDIRTTYSLRRIYICLRLMGGTDIYQLAKNMTCQRRDDRETTALPTSRHAFIAFAINVLRPHKFKNRTGNQPVQPPGFGASERGTSVSIDQICHIIDL